MRLRTLSSPSLAVLLCGLLITGCLREEFIEVPPEEPSAGQLPTEPATPANPAAPESPQGAQAPIVPIVPTPGSPPVPTGPRTPGALSLAYLQGLGKPAGLTKEAGGDPVFFLDTARSSISAYFILQNTGEEDVFDVELSTGNPAFRFSPPHIPRVPAANGAALMQVIKLIVTHGPRIDAAGYGTLLAPGPVETPAALTGRTVDGSDTITVTANAILKTYAKVAALRARAKTGWVNLSDLPSGITSTNMFGGSAQTFPHYYLPPQDTLQSNQPFSLHNTGNTYVALRVWNYHAPSVPVYNGALAPGDSVIISYDAVVEFDPGDVVIDPLEFTRMSNGKVMFALY